MLSSILTSVNSSCKALIRQTRCPRPSWNTLEETFKSVSEAKIDTKLSQLQAMILKKGERIVEYLSRILGLVAGLENAGHVVTEVEKKTALLRGMPKDCDMTVETMLSLKQSYFETVSKLIVRESRLQMTEEVSPLALVTSVQSQPRPRKCFYCDKPGHFARDCGLKNLPRERHENRAVPECFKYREAGHIAKNCRNRSGSGDTGVCQISTAMLMISKASSMMSRNDENSTRWMLDPCCSRHMSDNLDDFSTFLECEGIIHVPNNERIPSYGVGTVRMAAVVDGIKHNITLNDVVCAPKIMYNLIPIAETRKRNFRVRIDDDHENATVERMELYHEPTGKVKMCGFETANGLYQAVAQVYVNEAHVGRNKTVGAWHERLGHKSSELLRASVPHVHGIDRNELDAEGDCKACKSEKSTRVSRNKASSEERGEATALERVFSDVVGPMKYMSVSKSRYFATILNFCSGYSMVRFVGRKSEVAIAVMRMVNELECIMSSKLLHLTGVQRNNVKWLRTDGGGEYVENEFQNCIGQRGMVQEETATYSPESNGAAERLNRTLLDMARTMLL